MEFKVGMWYAAFDYVRLTRKLTDDEEAAKALYRKVCTAVLAQNGGEVPRYKPWAWQGYYGERCGPASYGAGVQGTLLQVSGAMAQEVRRLNPPCDGVPRLDVQVTVWLTRDTPHIARWVAHETQIAREKTHGQKWKVSVRDGCGDGDTCYIGSRQSDVFIRVYDKWRESDYSEEYRYAWRFEVELGGEHAQAVWAGAHSAEPDAHACAGWVRSYLERRGVALPVSIHSRLASAPPAPRPPTDDDRRLAWLRNQVAPAIDKLMANGVSLDAVEEALGLWIHGMNRSYTELRDKYEGE